jgi:hypothetical protein
VIETNPGRKKKNDMSSFLERMKAKQAEEEAAKGNNNPTEPAIPASQATGIVPPDGASRTTPVETKPAEAALAEAPKKRGRPKMTAEEKEARKKQRAAERLLAKAKAAQEEAEKAAQLAAGSDASPPVDAAPAASPEPTPEPTSTTAPVSEPAPSPQPETVGVLKPVEQPKTIGITEDGFTLYIDCYPVKGNGVPAILFDDWILPVIADINNEVDVADYRLLGFVQEKLALQAGLEKHLGNVPPVIVVSTASSVGKDALQTLIPHAKQVIRAMR